MASINLDVYKKSYMLEFIKNGAVDEVFTFSVPPENEQFDFAQRVVETKTFGGSVFENYGNDAVHITLSGSTGNGEAKLIYRGTTKTPLYLTGENEIWHLQELLQNWHDASVLTGTEERKIYLYDLSKMSALELAAMSPSGRNWWRVIIKNFQIKRQVSKPIYYTYTLDMVGLIEESHAEESFLKSLSDTVNDIAETIDTVNNYIQGAADALSLVTEAVETVQDIYEQFRGVDDTASFLLAFSSGVDTVNRAVNVNTNASFYSSTQSTLSAADSLSETIRGFAEEVYDDITDDDDDDEDDEETTSSSSSTDSSDSTDTTDGDTTDTDGDDTTDSGDGSTDDNTDTGSTGDDDTSGSGDDSTGGDSTDDTDGGSTDGDTTGDGSTDSGGDSTDDDTTSGGDTTTDTDGTGGDTTDSGSTGGGTDSTIADGTYTASYAGSSEELGEVSVTTEGGAATSVSVDSVECIQYGEGWVFANDEATYLITLDIGTSSISYTYTIETTE